MAKCPSHADRSPSLSVREVDDRTLIHCFSGCEAHDVLAAVGLTLGDLFEQPLEHRRAPVRDWRHVHAAREALKAVAFEAAVVLVACENAARGAVLTEADRERLAIAAGRIRATRDLAS